MYNQIYQHELNTLKENQTYRKLSISRGIDFCSNDYLGLAQSTNIKNKLIQYLSKSDFLGSTGSRLISGNSQLTEEIENEIADIFSGETSTLFGSGYMANIGVIQALSNYDTCFFSDEYNHASIIDGLRLSKTEKIIFKHNDLQDLEFRLKQSKCKLKVIIVESIYSMDGDSPNFEQLVYLCQKNNCLLIVDESHSVGVFGINGKGFSYSIRNQLPSLISVYPCGKALGSYGAFVCSSLTIKQLIINKSRSFIYSTALSTPMMLHIILSIREMLKSENLRNQLFTNVELFKSRLRGKYKGHHVGYIPMKNNIQAMNISNQLEDFGYFVRAIRNPTVSVGNERIRICLKSNHMQNEVINLANHLNRILQ